MCWQCWQCTATYGRPPSECTTNLRSRLVQGHKQSWPPKPLIHSSANSMQVALAETQESQLIWILQFQPRAAPLRLFLDKRRPLHLTRRGEYGYATTPSVRTCHVGKNINLWVTFHLAITTWHNQSLSAWLLLENVLNKQLACCGGNVLHCLSCESCEWVSTLTVTDFHVMACCLNTVGLLYQTTWIGRRFYTCRRRLVPNGCVLESKYWKLWLNDVPSECEYRLCLLKGPHTSRCCKLSQQL